MKIHETKKNDLLGINNKDLTLDDFRKKFLEEAAELSEALTDLEAAPGNKELISAAYGEYYDTMLTLLAINNKLINKSSLEDRESYLKQHHKKLKNRGWSFKGYWNIEYTSENRKKAIKLSEQILEKKKNEYYNTELNNYIKSKSKKNLDKKNEV